MLSDYALLKNDVVVRTFAHLDDALLAVRTDRRLMGRSLCIFRRTWEDRLGVNPKDGTSTLVFDTARGDR